MASSTTNDTRIAICTRFEDEVYPSDGDYYGVEAEPNAGLSGLAGLLWSRYLLRHEHMRTLPVEGMDSPLHVPERGWEYFHVYLRDDPTNTPLDQNKTLAELGLATGNNWVRFERAVDVS